MRGIIIFFIIFFVILAAGVVFLYIYFEKPAQEQQTLLNSSVNINIFTYSNKQISTGYIVEVNNIVFNSGKTLENAAIQVSVPINSLVKIYNYNLKNQQYYKTIQEFYINTTQAKRVNLELLEAGNLNIINNNTLGENTFINLIVNSDKYYKSLHFCIDWSIHIITVRSIYKEDVNNKKKGYLRCYDTSINLQQTPVNISLEYKWFDVIDNKDYIKVLFYDVDNGASEENNSDIGGENKEVVIDNKIYSYS